MLLPLEIRVWGDTMRTRFGGVCTAFFLLLGVGISAQSLKGMSLNGQTGLISIPTGRIGWERTADLGIDGGYHAILDDDVAHVFKGSLSLFRLAEVSFAYDTNRGKDNQDFLIGGKIQLPTSNTAIALGGTFQILQVNDSSSNAYSLYLATTYPGTFFQMPAETTITVGKTFGDEVDDSAIDFGMGFDLELFPRVLQGYIHWINDFANYSYSMNAIGANALNRGVFNTGIRIDLAANPRLSRHKFVVDAMLTDALDDNRSFALGASFGFSL